MKPNFKCPKCKTMQRMGKRLKGHWQCPKCKNMLVPTREMRQLGYMPYRPNAMFAPYNRPPKRYNIKDQGSTNFKKYNNSYSNQSEN